VPKICVPEVSWSRCGEADCIRIAGIAPDADVQLRPSTATAVGLLPAMAGRLVRDGAEACFVPRYPFIDGTAYSVYLDGAVAAELVREQSELPATTEVLAIYPTASEVPRNLLRCYVSFSASMSEGYAAEHIRLIDDAGAELPGALLPTEQELWDGSRRRLTVLLDPARIKRGLISHREVGYPLRTGTAFRLVVDAGLRDGRGLVLRGGAERRYAVGADERRHVEPHSWTLTIPASASCEPLEITFDRPLDHGLLARCLRVIDPGGQPVEGRAGIGCEQRSWTLTPDRAWTPGLHQLVVDPVLEDLAGNSVNRVFDRELARPQDEPRDSASAGLHLRPREQPS
jgi:hypothetical protein